MQYLVTTPNNPQYSGKVCGVRFENGRALVSEYTISPNLGRSVDEIATQLQRDFGYDVQPIDGAVGTVPLRIIHGQNAGAVIEVKQPITDENGIEQPEVESKPDEEVSLPRSNRQKRDKAGAKKAPEVANNAVSTRLYEAQTSKDL